jgi:hypothetical protein
VADILLSLARPCSVSFADDCQGNAIRNLPRSGEKFWEIEQMHSERGQEGTGIVVNQTHVFALCVTYAAMEEPARAQQRYF